MKSYSTYDMKAADEELAAFCQAKLDCFEGSKQSRKIRVRKEYVLQFKDKGKIAELAVCSMLGIFATVTGINIKLYSTPYMDKVWKVDFNINVDKVDHYVQLKWNNSEKVWVNYAIGCVLLRAAIDPVYIGKNELEFTETGSMLVRRMLVKAGVLSRQEVNRLYLEHPALQRGLDKFWKDMHIMFNQRILKSRNL